MWYFEYFRVVCTQQLSLASRDPHVWETLILRAAFTERCILQGVLALGALSRNTVPASVSSGKSTFLPGYQVGYSLNKYSLAIEELNRRLVDISTANWELAVLGSLIFIAIEALQGHEDVARMHLRSALAILQSSQGTTGCLTSKSRKDIDSALRSFSRLDLLSLRPVDHENLVPVRLPILPLCFRNTEEARDSLNSIVGAMNSLVWKESLVASQIPTQSHSPGDPSILQDLSALSASPRVLAGSLHRIYLPQHTRRQNRNMHTNPAHPIRDSADQHIDTSPSR